MQNHLYYPVSNYDLERKLVTRSARRLMKIAGGEMKLSKTREVIAAILGYRDCHDLEQAACPNDSAIYLLGYDRAIAHLLLARNIQRQLDVPADTASDLVNLLGFYSYTALKTNDVLPEGAEQSNALGELPSPQVPDFISASTSKISNVVVTVKRRRRIAPP